MFISNNTILTTENGTVLADTIFDKMYSVNGFVDINKQVDTQPTTFIKTELFPTITIGLNTELLIGKIEAKNKKLFIKNNFYNTDKIKEGDYIFIPKLNYKVSESLSRTLIWLYAKYLVSGYYCLEKQTNKPTIIINLKRFSKKEAYKLKSLNNVSYDLNNKIIVIQNEEIIEEFGRQKKNLNWKLYSCEEGLCNFFIHSINVETDGKMTFKHKTMAYDMFMFLYSKCNLIYKISETKDDNDKKHFILNKANDNEFLLAQNQLYTKITKITHGKNVKGIVIDNAQNDMFCITFSIMK